MRALQGQWHRRRCPPARLVCLHQYGTPFVCDPRNDPPRLVLEIADHHGNSVLDDPRLLERDFGNRVTQISFVVECDRCDDRHHGNNDVGGVETAAQSDLNHGNLHLVATKQLECDGRHRLEERWRCVDHAFLPQSIDS
jgi:hypothetical protein